MKQPDAQRRVESPAEEPGHAATIHARTKAPARRILILTPQFPFPPHQGTTMRNYNLIVHLARRNEVHLLSFGDPDRGLNTPIHDACQSVEVIPPPQRSMADRLATLVLSRLPDMAGRLESPAFHTALAQALARLDPDVVEVEGIELAQYLFQADRSRAGSRRPLLVYDDHNAEYVLQKRAFETDVRQPRRWVAAAYSLIQWQRLHRYERQACRTADRVVAVSQVDAAALQKLDAALEPVVVPNGVDVAYSSAPFDPLESAMGPGLVFTGKMDFRPNVDAVLWFAAEVLPLILREVPDAHLWVVGKDPHPRLAPLLDNPAVTVTGWVEDVRPYIARAEVYVIPLRIGGGTRLKVPEAMAMGKAIVSTSLGCEGFDLTPGQDLVIADAPDDFATSVIALLRDPERRALLGQAARRLAGEAYDWGQIVPRLESAYEL